MNTRVYLENLAATITESDLSDLFSAYGNIVAVGIPLDPTTRRPRGFCFVTMVTPEGARAAIQALNGKVIGTRTLKVSEICPVEEPASTRDGRRTPRRQASQLF